ncbi:MAG: hypothetical protein JW947_06095 [Sedimentisphaerales bacterium]|nr:hypothetical protein [Sedimentisphaerales bacterium]
MANVPEFRGRFGSLECVFLGPNSDKNCANLAKKLLPSGCLTITIITLGIRSNGCQSQFKGAKKWFLQDEWIVQHRTKQPERLCFSANGGLGIGVSASMPGNERGFCYWEAADVV